MLVAVAARPTRIVQGRAVVDAHPRLVRLEILALEKAHLVGRHHRRPGRRRQIHDRLQILLLLGPASALHFQIEPVREQLPPIRQPGLGLVEPVVEQRLPQFALAAAGQGDQALGIAAQPGVIEHWHAALLAFEIAAAHQPGQMAITGQILAQQHQPGRLALPPHPDLDPRDGLDPGPERGLVELDQGEQVAHVGHRHGRHPGGGDLLDQTLDADQPVHQRIFGVQAQVNERRGHGHSWMAVCSTAATGAKERRCSGQGPWRRRASTMGGGRIALVLGETVMGIALVQFAQFGVPRDLGQNGRGADRRHGGVALDDGLAGTGQSRTAVAIHQRLVRGDVQILDRPLHRQQRSLQNVEPVDLRDLGPAQRPGQGLGADFRRQLLAPGSAELSWNRPAPRWGGRDRG